MDERPLASIKKDKRGLVRRRGGGGEGGVSVNYRKWSDRRGLPFEVVVNTMPILPQRRPLFFFPSGCISFDGSRPTTRLFS